MENKQPSFAERTERMRKSASELLAMAESLTDIADVLHAEADSMAAAQKRFAERNGVKRERRAR